MKRIIKRTLSAIVAGSMIISVCTGCVLERKSPFFTMIETEHGDEEANAVLENFCEYVRDTDFTEFDYAYSQDTHNYQPGFVTKVNAYRNEKNTVFYAQEKETDYYYNAEDGILHCETGDLDGKQMEWSQFPFDKTAKKAYDMLSYLCETKDYLSVEYEGKALAHWNYKNRLSLSYWERDEEWDHRTPEWEEKFGESGPYSIAAFCNEEGTGFNSISMSWYEGALRYTVTWNSYEEILQSDRCVIRYEYDHGLREDNVPALDEQREQLKEEIDFIYE